MPSHRVENAQCVYACSKLHESRHHVVSARNGDMQQHQHGQLWGRSTAVLHTALHLRSTTAVGVLDSIIRRQLLLQLRMWMSQASMSQVCIRVASYLYLNTTSAIALAFDVGQVFL